VKKPPGTTQGISGYRRSPVRKKKKDVKLLRKKKTECSYPGNCVEKRMLTKPLNKTMKGKGGARNNTVSIRGG